METIAAAYVVIRSRKTLAGATALANTYGRAGLVQAAVLAGEPLTHLQCVQRYKRGSEISWIDGKSTCWGKLAWQQAGGE